MCNGSEWDTCDEAGMESQVATSVPGVVFGNGRGIFPTSFRCESLAHYFTGESMPSTPGNQGSSCLGKWFSSFRVLFGAIGLSLPGRGSCC